MQRLDALRETMSQTGLDALLITKDQNQRYFEGFTGSECYYLVTPRESFLIADDRYTEMAGKDCRYAKIVPHRDPFPPYNEVITATCKACGVKKLGFEADAIRFLQYDTIRAAAAGAGIEMTATTNLCENIRAVKDEDEIACISGACSIADRALEELLPQMKPGVSERDLVRELEYIMCRLGADAPSFDTMVLFGARSSQPHAVPSHDVRLKEGDLILIDYGALYKGYMSDTTRTFVSGKADARQKENYASVLRSQLAGEAAVKAGEPSYVVDKASRDVLAGEGCFNYGVGHGVGLEIHEQPFIRRHTQEPLKNGMIVTVEPGIYLPGWGGIRIEDTVCVRDEGAQILTHFPKEELMSV